MSLLSGSNFEKHFHEFLFEISVIGCFRYFEKSSWLSIVGCHSTAQEQKTNKLRQSERQYQTIKIYFL